MGTAEDAKEVATVEEGVEVVADVEEIISAEELPEINARELEEKPEAEEVPGTEVAEAVKTTEAEAVAGAELV